jgi:hypothetical protein
MRDDHGFDVDALVGHNLAEVLDHGLCLFITSDALDFPGAHGADHVSHSLSDGGLEHLIELAHIHAQIVNVITLWDDVKYD